MDSDQMVAIIPAMLLRVPVLQKLCDPTLTSPWGCWDVVTKSMVDKCIEDGLLKREPVHAEEYDDPIAHAQRVAYLMVTNWHDEIEVDIGIPDMGCHVNWPITDGNHRFMAAIFLERPIILASFAGSLDYADELKLIATAAAGKYSR